jgi:hypothetical protein
MGVFSRQDAADTAPLEFYELPRLGAFRARLDTDLSVQVDAGVGGPGWVVGWIARLADRRAAILEAHGVRFESEGTIRLARVDYRLTARVALVALKLQSSTWSIKWTGRSVTNGSPLTSAGRTALSSNAELRRAIVDYVEANLEQLQLEAVAELNANIQARLDQIVANCFEARVAAGRLAEG